MSDPKPFGILGLPRSGTTILCSVFNSAEASVCLCEPHWAMIGKRMEPLSNVVLKEVFGDTGLHCSCPDEIFDVLLEYGRSRGLKHCGVKETYRNWQKDWGANQIINRSDLSFLLAVHRDPRQCFASLKQQVRVWGKWVWDCDKFVKSYAEFFEDLKKCGLRVIHVKFEDFCKEGFVCLSKKLAGVADFNFSQKLNPMGKFAFGDPKAKQSDKIMPECGTADKAMFLTAPERQKVDGLYGLYNSVK